MVPSQEERADALGVQSRDGNGNNQYQSGNVVNTTIAPSQADHAESLGVSRPTVARWEKDRKEIMSDEDFGKWCKAKLALDKLHKHERAASLYTWLPYPQRDQRYLPDVYPCSRASACQR